MINLATGLTGAVWNCFGCRRNNNQLRVASAANIGPKPKEATVTNEAILFQIAAAVGKKHFSEAIKLTATLPEKEGLRDRVEKLVLLPFHHYFHHDYDLICRYKELRLLALAKDPVAIEKLKTMHACSKILSKMIFEKNHFHAPSIRLIDDQYNKPFMNSELPFFYVNYSHNLTVNLKRSSENSYSAEITFKNQVYCLPTSKETKFLIFFRFREGNNTFIGIFEGKSINGKMQFQSWGFKDSEPDKVLTTDHFGFLETINFDDPCDYDDVTVRKIISCIKSHGTLYKNEKSKSSVIRYINELGAFASHDFLGCVPFFHENSDPKHFQKRLFWIPDRCSHFQITEKDLKVEDKFRSFFDPNGLRYRLENDSLRVTAIAEDERKWVRDSENTSLKSEPVISAEGTEQLKAKMESSHSIEFVKATWQEMAATYMQVRCGWEYDRYRTLNRSEVFDDYVTNQILLRFEKHPQRYCLVLETASSQPSSFYKHLFFGENGVWHKRRLGGGSAQRRRIIDEEFQSTFGSKYVVKKSVDRDTKCIEGDKESEDASKLASYSIQMHPGGEFESLVLVSREISEDDAAANWQYGLRKMIYMSPLSSAYKGSVYNVCFNQPRLWFSFKYLALEAVFASQKFWSNDLTRLIHDYDNCSVDDYNRAAEID